VSKRVSKVNERVSDQMIECESDEYTTNQMNKQMNK